MADVDSNDEDTAFVVNRFTGESFNPYKLAADKSVDMIETPGTYLKGKTQ